MYKEQIMKTTTMTLVTILAMTGTLFAGGGKAIAPAESVIAPIVEPIDPLPFYVGAGILATFIDRDPCPCGGGDIQDHRYGGVIRAGYDFNQYIGLEARGLKTFGNDVFSEVTHYGVYVKPQYHISPQSNIYGLLGYGKTKVDYTNGILSSQTDENSFAYGVGFEYDFGNDQSEGQYDRIFDGQGDQEKGWGMWVDFQHLLGNAGAKHTDLNVFTAGITYDF